MGTWRQREAKKKSLIKQKVKVLLEIEKLIDLNREYSLLHYEGIKNEKKKEIAFFHEDFVDEDTGEVISIERSEIIPFVKEFSVKDLDTLINKFDKFPKPSYYGT